MLNDSFIPGNLYTVEPNSHTKYVEMLCELSEHANYPSLFYITFCSMVASCVQDNRAIYLGGAN